MASNRGSSGESPLIALLGPTAAGKTGLALSLAERLDVELVSMDSAQVYRGLDIGSAKPDAATLARFPHRLIDIRAPEDSYSAADFARDAGEAIEQARARGRRPLLVGGTMLYFRALVYGLDPLPPADASVRAAIADEAERRGWEALHAELGTHDPEAAAAIAPGDRQRIQRALEILRLTGHGPGHFHRHNRLPRWPVIPLVVTPTDRAVLHRRIERRFDEMLERGLPAEVERLRQRPGLTREHASMRSVGYRQLWQHLDGAISLAQARSRALAATRQLAKRQLTALRQVRRACWYDPVEKRTIDFIYRYICHLDRQLGRP